MKLDRQRLGQLAALRLHAPGVATSLQQGDRRSPFKGRGVEFADYRAYDAAEDIRLVDWNVYLRLGTALVRQFHEERSFTLLLALDLSASMGFGQPRKADSAAMLTAALATVALVHRDPVTLCCVGHGGAAVHTRAVNQDGLASLLHVLEQLEPARAGEAGSLARELGQHLGRNLGRGRADRAVLVSDLLVEPDEREAILRLLATASRHPLLVHVLARDELEPAFGDLSGVVDAETGETLTLRDDGGVTKAYAQALEDWLGVIAGRCRELGVQYLRLASDRDVPAWMLHELRRTRVVEHAAGGNA